MLRELIRYIVIKVLDQEGMLGTTRLVKLLYLIDVEYYRRHRKPLTDLKWLFYRYGPYAFEVPDVLHSLDLDLPQDDVALGGGRIAHIFRPSYLPEVNIEGLVSTSDNMLIDKIIDEWALEDLNRLLSHVYFDTEPMRGARVGQALDFSTIPELTFPKYLPEDKLKLTDDETTYFKAKLTEYKQRQTELRKLAERQCQQVHASVDHAYDEALEQMEQEERINLPIHLQVVGPILEDSSASETSKHG